MIASSWFPRSAWEPQLDASRPDIWILST